MSPGSAHHPPAEHVPDPEETAAILRLKQYPFLAGCSEIVLRKLLPNLVEQPFAAGETILRAGGYSDAAHYLASGTVAVRMSIIETDRPAPAAPDTAAAPSFSESAGRVLGRGARPDVVQRGGLGDGSAVLVSDVPVDLTPNQDVLLEAGDVFGEMSALSRYPVSADVIARTDVTCLLIRVPALRMMFKQKELAGFKKMIDERYRSRTLANQLRSVELFVGLDEDSITQLQAAAELSSYEPGAVIVAEGAPADAFYLVRGGFVKVAVRAGAADAAVSYLRRGDHAGEIGLLLDQPWPLSLHAIDHVEMVTIGRDAFRAVLAKYPDVERMVWDTAVARLKERGRAVREPLTARYLQLAMDTGLINGESVLLIDLNTCTRCDDCVRGCADTHGGTPRFVREGTRFRQWSVPQACYHCTDPVCMIGCPTGAIARPLGTLEVTINKDTCIGCHNCGKRCPWDNIVDVPFHSPTLGRDIEMATKCDLCLGRPQGPACVQMCPHGSAVRISFKDPALVSRTLSDASH
jgi:CRP-like cAMP-binding protein/Fe-S-cluster-containing hydrogenase component 2